MGSLRRMVAILALLPVLATLVGCSNAPACMPPLESITWVTGDFDLSPPSGSNLLSDNEGYWGESVLTGVTYRYESSASNPPDRIANQSGTFGRRLLDGRIRGDWHIPVGQSRGPLVVVFDFHRPCRFTEVDTFCSRSKAAATAVAVSDQPDGPWTTVFEEPLADAGERELRRLRLPNNSRGRYLRLSIEADGITHVDEVLVWGWGESSPEWPEHIAPTWRGTLPDGMLESVPGIETTRFPATRLAEWRDSLGMDAPAVWSAASAATPEGPVLPDREAINAPVRLSLARNETESCYLTLTNTSPTEELSLTINDIELRRSWRWWPEPRVKARLLIGGALPSVPPKQRLTPEQRLRLMADGDLDDADTEGKVAVLPFFDQGQMLGRSLMERYLTNGVAIRDYPRLRLPPGGSAVFMLRLTTDRAPAGRYTGVVSATTNSGRTVKTPLVVQVADVLLPDVDVWIRSYANGTRQFPFESRTRIENDARVNRELGVTVWQGFPTPGSKAEAFGTHGRTYFRMTGIPSRYVHLGYLSKLQADDLTEEDVTAVAEHVRDLVRQAGELGLDYDEWWVELWDEPQESNVALFGALARIIKQTDPRVRIYMNPLFWRPGHAPPEEIVKHLAPYYNELIDISVPISTLVRDGAVSTRDLWSQPRFVRAFFIHPADRGGRRMGWRAFSLGYNGWGYYCYYSPRGNPWDIRTWSSLNYRYQMVFPGPNGPILMPIYETMRDGWEDYRLLTALREAGHEQLVESLLDAFRNGESLPELRLRGLQPFL